MSIASGLVCPTPHAVADRVQLGHGSGGTLTAALLRDHVFPVFDNPVLRQQGDGAVIRSLGPTLVMSTDSFVVHPLEFPGGDIGLLAVHGTCNDLAMMGAHPRVITAGFVLEEGLEVALLDRVLASMGRAVRAAGIDLVAGDTKVVERGRADGLYVCTTGLGARDPRLAPLPSRARPGDAIIVSGAVGRHGMAIMAAREGLAFEAEITSDTAALWPLVDCLAHHFGDQVHVLRDPTRGGVASALTEIALASRVGMRLAEERIPVPDPVAAACAMLGLDPLYVANEGILLAILPAEQADRAVELLREHPIGAGAARIGTVVEEHPGIVTLQTPLGGTRVVDLLPGDQLPRIC
ncbi:MAG TPA: hydrogenase expression/formation protein HypE [Gemmatimonadales bacterium]|nr:hydrogenase expression/formation protein HypE [Gemmatimonadales bacterium]